MKLKVKIKQASQKKLTNATLVLQTTPTTIKQLIEASVIATLNSFQDRQKQSKQFFKNKASSTMIFSEKAIQDQLTSGKMGFNLINNNHEVSEGEAINTAIEAFNDGLVAIFINEKQYEDLNATIALNNDDTITFIKLVLLAGRMW